MTENTTEQKEIIKAVIAGLKTGESFSEGSPDFEHGSLTANYIIDHARPVMVFIFCQFSNLYFHGTPWYGIIEDSVK